MKYSISTLPLAACALVAALLVSSAQPAEAATSPANNATLFCQVTGQFGPNQGPFLLSYATSIDGQNTGSILNPQPAPNPSQHSSEICKSLTNDMCEWIKATFPTSGFYATPSFVGVITYPVTIKVAQDVFGVTRKFSARCQ